MLGSIRVYIQDRAIIMASTFAGRHSYPAVIIDGHGKGDMAPSATSLENRGQIVRQVAAFLFVPDFAAVFRWSLATTMWKTRKCATVFRQHAEQPISFTAPNRLRLWPSSRIVYVYRVTMTRPYKWKRVLWSTTCGVFPTADSAF